MGIIDYKSAYGPPLPLASGTSRSEYIKATFTSFSPRDRSRDLSTEFPLRSQVATKARSDNIPMALARIAHSIPTAQIGRAHV